MATASIIKEMNPEFLRYQNQQVPFGKLQDMFGAPVTHHKLGANHPVSFKTLTQMFDGERSLTSEDRVRAYVNRWTSWHATVLTLTPTRDLNDIVDSFVEFEPELPARLSEFVAVPIIDRTAVQKRAKFFMYGIGAMFEWGRLGTAEGVDDYEKSMVSLASNITLLFKLITHASLWKAKIEVSRIMQLTGLPYMGGWAYERLNQPGYGFGVLHSDTRGLIELASAVRNTMSEVMNTDYEFIVMSSRLQGLLSLGDESIMQQFRDPAALAAFKARGMEAVNGVMGKPIRWEQDYVYRGRGEMPDEVMTVPFVTGAFWVSDNSYLAGWSETPHYNTQSTGFGTANMAPPNTGDYRNLEFLNLSKNDVEWDTIHIVDLIQNCLCYDQRDPMLPLRRRFYEDLARNHNALAERMDMSLPRGANNGEKQVSPFVYFDSRGTAKVVKLWGHMSRVYENSSFIHAAVRVARQRIVALIGGEQKVHDINEMANVLDLAYKRFSGMPTDKADVEKWYFEAFCYAVSQHDGNKTTGSWALKANEFGVVNLPPLNKAALGNVANGKICFMEGGVLRAVVATPGNNGDLVTFAPGDIANGNVHYRAPGIPHGFSTIGHARTLVQAVRANDVGGWDIHPGFMQQVEVLERGLVAFDLYLDQIVAIFGIKFDTANGGALTPAQRRAYENLFMSNAVVPAYLRASETEFATIARRSNLSTAVYEMTWAGINKAPLFIDVNSFTGAAAAAFPSQGMFLSTEDRAEELFRQIRGDNATLPARYSEEALSWQALAFALDTYLGQRSGALSDSKAGFAQLKAMWENVPKTTDVGEYADKTTRDTFAGWLNWVRKTSIEAAIIGNAQALLEAGLRAADPKAVARANAAADANVVVMAKNAADVAKTVNGLFSRLSRSTSGIGARAPITAELLRTLPALEPEPVVRGVQKYEAAGKEDQPQTGAYGYVNLRMSVDPAYFYKAKTNNQAAFDNPLRPADASSDNMRPLAPRRADAAQAANLAILAHGSADNSILHTWTGTQATGYYHKTPAITERQPEFYPLSHEQGTLSYDEHSGRALPSYFQWDAIAEIGECPDMVNRLKEASTYTDHMSRSLAFLFLGQPVYGKKQQQWAEMNLPVFLTMIVLAHNVRFDMHAAYFLNSGIGNLFYGYQESMISVDGIHFKLTVQIRFFAASYIKNENRMLIAPYVAYRRYKGGIDKTFITRLEYNGEEADPDFNIHNVRSCRKSLFVLPMGPSQTADDLAEVVSLVPRHREGSDLTQHYAGANDGMYNNPRVREPTFPSAFEFNVATEYYKVGAAPREQTQQYSVLKACGAHINDMCYIGPQLVRKSGEPRKCLRRGGGPFKNMCPGIRSSLMGGPRVFSPQSIGTINTVAVEGY